jgi:hypothetical protein
MTLREMIDDFILDIRPAVEWKKREFLQMPSLEEAVRGAAFYGPHTRASRVTLREVERRLQAAHDKMLAGVDFEHLRAAIAAEVAGLRGVGGLTIYDIAIDIGTFLGREPTRVYLFCGARKGARSLGLRGETLDPKVLPQEFSRLSPREIEDFLCCMSKLRGRLRQGSNRPVCGESSPRRSAC